jgi:hypothetical protein
MPAVHVRKVAGATLLTVAEPRALDGAAARVLNLIAASLAAALLAAWVLAVLVEYVASPGLLAWCVMAACVLAACGATGRFERLSALVLLAAVFVPVAEPHRNLRGAFLLVGVPWLALFAARTLPQVGHFSAYSNDDWLAYQVAGYRIFMHGFWLEGGSKVFDYQPLYRWMSGLLHLIFGDSSVAGVHWDTVCPLLGALACVRPRQPAAGFDGPRPAAATLATFSLGRSGISWAAGCRSGGCRLGLSRRDRALRAQNARATVAAAAGALAVLMFPPARGSATCYSGGSAARSRFRPMSWRGATCSNCCRESTFALLCFMQPRSQAESSCSRPARGGTGVFSVLTARA